MSAENNVVVHLPGFIHFMKRGEDSVDRYQEWCKTTAVFPDDVGLMYCALKLNGEAGEVAEKIGKLVRDRAKSSSNGVILHHITAEDKTAIVRELGDVLWYLGQIAEQLGVTLTQVISTNVTKLAVRRATNKICGSGDNR